MQKSLKVSGRKEELKIRLRKHLEPSQNQDGDDAEENSSKRKEELKIPRKRFELSQIQDGGVSGPSHYKVKKQPEIQKRPPCLTAEETERSAPATGSNPIFSENEEEYEADDEDELLQRRQRQGPKPSSSPCESHKEDLQRLNEKVDIIGQKSLYFDKIVELLVSERIKTSKLTEHIEHLQRENQELQHLIDSKPIPTTPDNNIPVPFYVETPTIHEITDTSNFCKNEERLKEQNDKLRNELENLKSKKIQEDLKAENQKLQHETTTLQNQLKTTKEQPKQEEKKKQSADKKVNIVIAGDSMLNNIEDRFDLNTRKANVSIRPFPGATIEDMKDYITPITRKQPNILIIHTGTNNVRDGKPKDIVDKLVKLQRYAKSISPDTNIVLSNIIRRQDYKQEQLGQKIIEINSLLALECKKYKIDLIDHINVTGIGRKGLHPNNLGKEQITSNLLEYISRI